MCQLEACLVLGQLELLGQAPDHASRGVCEEGASSLSGETRLVGLIGPFLGDLKSRGELWAQGGRSAKQWLVRHVV